MSIPQRFLQRKFKLQSSDNHDDFFAAQGFSRCHRLFRSKLSDFRGGAIRIDPVSYGLAYLFKARIYGKDREIKFRPGQQVRGVGFNGRPVEISFTMEGDYLKEVHVPLGKTRRRPDCIYYDAVKDTLIVKAFHYCSDPQQPPIVWERIYSTKDPVQDQQPYRDQFDEML
ncbi:hypothetical protein PENTCL1PPCAC_28331 [Pristionchus entomophagus]|uniref:Uncharacterized protein n=1 Tax=Pristionchus entomophagus TaxID=358040 RepID=A0AAV5UGU0_9BILA|nr:hypothetical protein PENTCL1PPCAC_28331 [Pristionchus entomophagus]